MHFPTFLQTLVLGVLGSILLGGLFNMPDGGAVVAIAFVGSIIVNLLIEKKRLKSSRKRYFSPILHRKTNDEKESSCFKAVSVL